MSLNVVNSFKHFVPFNDADLKAYWKFDEASGDIINQSQAAGTLGVGADMQTTDVTYGVPGIIGDAVRCNGTSSLLTIGTSKSQLNFTHNTTSLMSFIHWMKSSSTSGDQKMVSGSGLLDEIGWNMSNQANGKYTYQILQ